MSPYVIDIVFAPLPFTPPCAHRGNIFTAHTSEPLFDSYGMGSLIRVTILFVIKVYGPLTLYLFRLAKLDSIF